MSISIDVLTHKEVSINNSEYLVLLVFIFSKSVDFEKTSAKKEEAEIQQKNPDDSQDMKTDASKADDEAIKDGMNDYLDMTLQNDYEGLDQETLISPEERARKNIYIPLPG